MLHVCILARVLWACLVFSVRAEHPGALQVSAHCQIECVRAQQGATDKPGWKCPIYAGPSQSVVINADSFYCMKSMPSSGVGHEHQVMILTLDVQGDLMPMALSLVLHPEMSTVSKPRSMASCMRTHYLTMTKSLVHQSPLGSPLSLFPAVTIHLHRPPVLGACLSSPPLPACKHRAPF